MGQMEAFTEIMLGRFYPVCPGVSALCPGDGCLPFQKGSFWGAACLQSPATA